MDIADALFFGVWAVIVFAVLARIDGKLKRIAEALEKKDKE